MSIILIPATKSLTVTSMLPNGNIIEDIITVGRYGTDNYISYLFFDISAIPSNVAIMDAELVLFKTNNFYNNFKKDFSIYPLSDYFSTYTTFNNRPKINASIKKTFYPITSKVAVTTNLTCIVSLWMKNQLATTGIALLGKNCDIVTEFGSAISIDTYLIPFIKVFVTPIVYNQCCHKDSNREATTKQIQVIGTVAAASKYEAIVNVGVTRGISGITDNYYITDEYDNSTSSSDLYIDKTYNMAIIPKENPGDVETINFYGSYKV